jgi:hypothetical protein
MQMLRIVFFYILPFILPTILYLIWAKKSGGKDIPIAALLIAGAILLGISAGAFALWDKSPAFSHYEAPKFKDGLIIPAQVGNKTK